NEEARLEAIGRSWKAAGVDAAVRTAGFPGTYLPVPAPHAERSVSVVVTGHFSDEEKAGAEALFRRDPHVREVLFTGAADAGARLGDGPADTPSGENNPSCSQDVHAPSGENVCPPSVDTAVRAASGPYVFLTDRVPEALSDGFFETLAFYLSDPANGAAGPMLVADGRVVHAGYAFSEGKLFVPYRGVPAGAPGYRGRLALPGDTASCTAAGMLVRKDVYEEAGGFDTALEALRDVDFCLRIRELGYGAVFAPDAVMTLPAGDAGRVLPDGEAGALGRSLEKLVRRYRKRTLEDPWYPRSFSAEQGGYVLSPVRKPVLPSTLKDRLYLAVDKAAFTDAGIELTGWAVSISRTVRYAVTDREKRPVPFTFEAVSRPNVLDFALKDTVWDRDYGFRILVRDTAGGPYTVTVSDGRQEEHFTFSPDEKKLVWRYDVKNRVRNLVRSPGAVLSAVTEAPVSFVREAAAYLKPEADRYREWLKKHLPDEKTLEVQRRTTFTYRPKISLVVPAYRTPEKFLLEMVDSVTRQTYDNWELCIADGSAPDTSVRDAVHRLREKDPRIRYTFLPGNRGISGNTNAALAMARGDWIALMDHDDILAPSVLFEMVARMNEDPETDCIYTDEDKITMDLSRCFYPSLKPEFDVDYLRSGNYICHFFAVKKELADRVGLFDPQCDGAQDLDYALRATECARKVAHLPRVLYHWRSHPDSTAADSRSKMYCYEAGKRAVNKHCERTGLPAKAFISPNFGRYHLFFDPPEEEPLISVVIWGDGGEAAAERTKASILAVSGYRHYEFLYGETAAEAASRAAGAYLYFIQAGSAVRPFELESVEGEYISDELVRRAAFPYNMLGALRDPACGFAAGKVVDAENSVCYGGILKNPLHAADYVFYGMQNGNTGYNGMLVDRHRVIAGSLMNLMMRRADYERAGGLSPRFASCFGEVDLCYRLDEAGYYGVFDPMVTTALPAVRHPHMPHRRFKKEAALAAKIHAAFLAEPDPWSTPHMGCFLREYVLR
ncbi:MAG: glycosyltransferase, partial [Lachnospiraceae bacterium]|nr:glycosyltransferase [Lachnospiraceae bacterium]